MGRTATIEPELLLEEAKSMFDPKAPQVQARNPERVSLWVAGMENIYGGRPTYLSVFFHAVILLAALLGILLYRKRTKPKPQATVASPVLSRFRWRVTPILLVVAAGFALLFAANRGLFDLGVLMLRIDLFAFGGGFASVPLMYHEIVDVRSWMDGETFMNGIALGQVTPGPIVITATFVGFLLHGTIGAVVATLSVFLPSFLVLVAVAPHFDRLRTSPLFAKLITGALCSFPGLLLIVTVHFAQTVRWDMPRALLAGAAFAALRFGANILWVVLIGTGLSLIFCR